MDDADRAQMTIEAEMLTILRARRDEKTYRLSCSSCFATLEKHRREYGLCVECAQDREARRMAFA